MLKLMKRGSNDRGIATQVFLFLDVIKHDFCIQPVKEGVTQLRTPSFGIISVSYSVSHSA